MQWSEEAAKRLERVPFFIRKKVKKQIEDFVQAKGTAIVTNDDVSQARQQLAGKAPLETPQGKLTAANLERIEQIVEKGVVIQDLNTKFQKFNICGGAAGCPLSLIDEENLAGELAKIINQAELDKFITGGVDGPILFHHQFKVAVAGCPNSCSQPQIADFGVTGQARPKKNLESCTHCQLCLEACQEEAVKLDLDGPVFDYNLCLNCGNCARSCPREVITDEQVGYKVMIGGKLGRRPQLAQTLAELVDQQTVKKIFKATLDVYKAQALDGERFAGLVQRLGTEKIRSLIRHKQT